MKLTMLYENKDGHGFYRVKLTTRLNEHLLGSPYPPNKDGKEQFLHKNSRAETIADAWYYAAWQNPRFFDKFKRRQKFIIKRFRGCAAKIRT